MLTPFEPQAQHIKRLAASLQGEHTSALDSSDMGTGKTLCAVETAKLLGLTPFVICPKAVVTSWERCLEGQGVSQSLVYSWEKLRAGGTEWLEKRGKKRVNFIWKVPQEKALLIFDEVHKAKGHKTQNGTMVITAKKLGYSMLMLSATAAEDPRELRAIGYALGLHTLKNYWSWAEHWGCEFDTFGSLQFPEKNKHLLVDLNKLIYPERGSRMTREELGDQFNTCRIITDPINFATNLKKMKSLFEELDDELTSLEERRELDGEDPIALTKILRLRQETELLKVPQIVSLIQEARESKLHVSVFLNFTETIKAVSHRLKEDHVFIWGEQTAKERQVAMDRFQSNSVGIILCNIAAGGVGVSLHDTLGDAPRVSFISPTYNAKDFHQTTGRVDRLGAKSESVQRVLVAADTLEEKIVERMMQKIENMSLLHAKSVDNTDMSDEVDEVEEPAHAEFGPSSMKNVQQCPGYKSKEGTNPAAEQGTRIHEALETGDWSKMDDYETSLAQYTENVERSILDSSGFDKFEDHKEIRLTMELIGHTTFGTCDRLCIQGAKGIEIDYKTGVYEVHEPAANCQAKCYVLGAFQKFPMLDEIDFYFIACKRDEILFDTFYREDVPQLVEELSAIIARAQPFREDFSLAGVDDLVPDSLLCEYCANAGQCPAITAKLLEVASHFPVEDGLPVPSDIDPESADNETVSQMLKLMPVFDIATEGWKAKARALLKSGYEVPDFELSTRAGKRKINSVKAAWGIAHEHGVELEDFLEALASYPVGKFEKLVAANAKRGKKKDQVKSALGALIEDDFIDFANDVDYLSRSKDKK